MFTTNLTTFEALQETIAFLSEKMDSIKEATEAMIAIHDDIDAIVSNYKDYANSIDRYEIEDIANDIDTCKDTVETLFNRSNWRNIWSAINTIDDITQGRKVYNSDIDESVVDIDGHQYR